MNLQQKDKIESIIREGYIFYFSEYFTKGMNIFKKDIGSFVGYALVYIIISIVLGFIPILGSIASVLTTYPLMMGFVIVAHKINRDETFEFGEFFKGFDFFVPLFLQYLVIALISCALLIPLAIYAYLSLDLIDPNIFAIAAEIEKLAFPLLFLMVPIFYLAVSWRWAPYFIVFYQMPFWEAMETSRRLVGRKFWPLLGFLVLLGLLMMSGIIAFIFGIVITLPLAMCIDYAAFADVTRLMEEGDVDMDLTEHFVE